MLNMRDITFKATRHKAMLDSVSNDIKSNDVDIDLKSRELDSIESLLNDTNVSFNYLYNLVNVESNKFITRLSDMLNYGIKTIFYDCDYTIEIRVKDNKASIYLVYEDIDNDTKVEAEIHNCGGGIRTVIGFLIQVYFLFYTRSERIIFVDEGFSQISSQYIERFFSLIKELAKSNNLKIVLITHDDRFVDYADKNYEIRDGKSYLI